MYLFMILFMTLFLYKLYIPVVDNNGTGGVMSSPTYQITTIMHK